MNRMNADNPLDISQSAQVSAVEQALTKVCSYLNHGCKDGYWSYVTGKGPSTEATVWCALALYAANEKTSAREIATNFLLKNQNKDGGWSTAPVIGQSEWCTGPALLALRIFIDAERDTKKLKAMEAAIAKAYSFLFDMRVELYRASARLVLLLLGGVNALHYGRGWPWNAKCSHWVEPSSYALYALKVMGIPDYVGIKAAVNFANDYFYEHACADGGWNHGAHKTLGVDLPSYAVTTGEALVALQDSKEKSIIDAALKRLQTNHNDNDTALALSWAILAFDLHHVDYSDKLNKLLRSQHKDGSFGPNNIVSAIASLALSTARGKNLLKIKT
ncbi:MAG: prenyltransferase/squalene oxidase repeat-containing protein [Candidatus Obscuribacterales bacterium]|nr:prenyltransferase/squalene oxidase repeat-containing protein [Candidatus Obscuribacterales bacterium]